jgi:uncharacterized protein with HEPN domain
MSKSPLDYLNHILDECKYVVSVITDDTVKDDLLDDETLKRAIVRSLEIIGEAAKRLTTYTQTRYLLFLTNLLITGHSFNLAL